jgi:hypothetical protein
MADSLSPCPACQTALRVPDEFRGKVITCLECQTSLLASPLSQDAALKRLPPSLARGTFPPRVFVAMAALLLLARR